MNYTDYIANNDHTDVKNYELVVRVFKDGGFSFGWYRCAESKKAISDSQFDVGIISPDNAEEIIKERFSCYFVGR